MPDKKGRPFDEGVLNCAEDRVSWQTIFDNLR